LKNARNAYEDVADDLQAFIQFMDRKPARTFAELCHYIKTQQSRQQIAALHVGLAPVLRQLGVEKYLDKLKSILDEDESSAHPMIKDAIALFEDGIDAGQESLSHLARDFFGINFTLYETDGRLVAASELMADVPAIAILHSSDSTGHFDFLLPESHAKHYQSIATVIPDLTITSQLEQQVKHLRGHSRPSQDDVVEIAATVARAGVTLLSAPNSVADVKQLTVLSSEALMRVRARFQVADSALKTWGVESDIESTLLKHGLSDLTDEMSGDELLAYILQAAELLSFYQKNYATLTPYEPYINYRGQRVSDLHAGLFASEGKDPGLGIFANEDARLAKK
jgi:hypothetical protein